LPTYFQNKGSGISNYRLFYHISDEKLFKMYLSLVIKTMEEQKFHGNIFVLAF
jgi:hypothetical protein